MALIQANFISRSLMRTVPIQVILPVDKMAMPGEPLPEEKPLKTLYLLHGIIGNYTDWLSGSNIQRYAEEKNLAVVMPSGDNAFYVDQEKAHNLYGEFIGQELVEMTRKMFPLSRKREDTFIAGLSMGGYGAIRNGLKYHETFSHIASLSGALVTDGMEKRTNDAFIFAETRDYAEAVFGDLDALAESDKNPKWLAAKLAKEGVDIPKMYITCGTEDFLLGANRDYRDFLLAQGIEPTYVEGPGSHEWDFWDRSIKNVLDWLPLDEAKQGINSGNIGKE